MRFSVKFPEGAGCQKLAASCAPPGTNQSRGELLGRKRQVNCDGRKRQLEEEGKLKDLPFRKIPFVPWKANSVAPWEKETPQRTKYSIS